MRGDVGWPHSLVGYIRFPDEPQTARRIWGTRLVGGWPIRQMPVNAYSWKLLLNFDTCLWQGFNMDKRSVIQTF